MSRRLSNRTYPEIKCANPACGVLFVPHDRRQIYCERQCGINYNNDLRHYHNNTTFADEKVARKNNGILKRIWGRMSNQKKKHVSKEILQWEGFRFDSQALSTRNTKTASVIRWYYDFGLEIIDEANSIFEIHQKD